MKNYTTGWQDGTSPAQLFFGRRQRLGLPLLPEMLGQSNIDPLTRDSLHKDRISDRDAHTVCLPDFAMGGLSLDAAPVY